MVPSQASDTTECSEGAERRISAKFLSNQKSKKSFLC